MRIIPYRPKKTRAGTEYREIRGSDRDWILAQCSSLVGVAQVCRSQNYTEGAALNHNHPLLPRKSGGGRNTPATLCEGITHNFSNQQRDFSEPQCRALEVAFQVGSEVIENFEPIKFEPVDELPKISAPAPTPAQPALDTDLFEIDSMTVSYKKKQAPHF